MRVISWRRLAEEVVAKEVALVLSVQHTGTWFAIEFLRQHGHAGPFHELNKMIGGPLTKRSIVHAHVADRQFAGPKKTTTPLGRTDGSNAIPTYPAYEILAKTGRVVMPMRDPMLSILTRHGRHPLLAHTYIVEAFTRVAEHNEGVTFLPIDCVPDMREGLLYAALRAARLPKDIPYVEQWAREWTPYNVSTDTAEKQWYRDGEWGMLRAVLTEEIDELLDSRDVLIPFLQELGYKELSWWTL